ncbi:uncharacterized protein LOC141853236 [Brevipalpus obovatus]|uniref:uncharacterized protein LOC141853236 n=1 Tax=Brevipalpus obovatus TaxID=246614 RepID=UPI003D9E8E5B
MRPDHRAAITLIVSIFVLQNIFSSISVNAQNLFTHPYLGLQFNPQTSALWGYGLGPQYGTLFGQFASNYLYGGVGPFNGVPAYVGYPGGYGLYGSFGALGVGTQGVVNHYKNYYGYDGMDGYKLRMASQNSIPNTVIVQTLDEKP